MHNNMTTIVYEIVPWIVPNNVSTIASEINHKIVTPQIFFQIVHQIVT